MRLRWRRLSANEICMAHNSATWRHACLLSFMLLVLPGCISSCDPAVVPMPEGADQVINYGFARLRFTGAVPAGARVRAHFALSDLKVKAGDVTLFLAVTVEVEGQPRPAIVADWIIRALRNVPS